MEEISLNTNEQKESEADNIYQYRFKKEIE